jgi:hypothetical protein
MSAGLLLFGLMTIWLPPIRAALFLYPLATLSILLCLGLIFKFAQQGGAVGLMTGGVLALYLIGVIVADTQRAVQPSPNRPTPQPTLPPVRSKDEISNSDTPVVPPPSLKHPSDTAIPYPPQMSEPRTLLASKGAVLKFVAGITYHLKVRTGFTTSLYASHGKVALYSEWSRVSECLDKVELLMPAASSPYQEIGRTIRSCGVDAIFYVHDIR